MRLLKVFTDSSKDSNTYLLPESIFGDGDLGRMTAIGIEWAAEGAENPVSRAPGVLRTSNFTAIFPSLGLV